jgi:hypothetical protein
MAEKPVRVRLSDDEVERIARAAVDDYGRKAEQFARLARPEEREAIALELNPVTAHLFFLYCDGSDPYGDYPDLPEEERQIGREYFACDQSDGVSVHFSDLPERTQETLARKREAADEDGWKRVLEM